MRDNTYESDNTIISRAAEALRQTLPDTWRVTTLESASQQSGPDAVIRLESPGGPEVLLGVEVKRWLDPRDVPYLVSGFQQWRGAGAAIHPLLVSPYLGERTRSRLQAAGAGTLDLTGNIHLQLDEPFIYLDRAGASKNPFPRTRPARSLKGAKAGRLVRALLDCSPPFGTRELAAIAGIDPGYTSRLLGLLEREDILERRPRGPVISVDWAALLDEWTKEYSLMVANNTASFLQPRAMSAFLDTLRAESGSKPSLRYAITGSLVAGRRAPVAPARMAVVYVDRHAEAAAKWELMPAESGANVLLVEPFDEVVYERGIEEDGLKYVALSQAAADLTTSPGRGPEEADRLIDWMKAHEESWRA